MIKASGPLITISWKSHSTLTSLRLGVHDLVAAVPQHPTKLPVEQVAKEEGRTQASAQSYRKLILEVTS